MPTVSVHLENPLRDGFFQHFIDRLTGRDHRVNLLILLNYEIHHQRAGGVHRLPNGRLHLGFVGYPYAAYSVSCGQLYEVGLPE